MCLSVLTTFAINRMEEGETLKRSITLLFYLLIEKNGSLEEACMANFETKKIIFRSLGPSHLHGSLVSSGRLEYERKLLFGERIINNFGHVRFPIFARRCFPCCDERGLIFAMHSYFYD